MNKFLDNVLRVFLSNVLIIASGILVGFLLPKILGVTEYGYYKVFNLYSTYVVFFNLGIPCGIFLLFGSYNLEQLPKEKFRFFFRFLLLIQLLSAAILALVAILISEKDYFFIIISLSFYLVFSNICSYFENISIITNNFKVISKRNLLKSFLTIISVLLLLFISKTNHRLNNFKIFIILFNIVYFLLAFMYTITYKSLVFGKSEKLKDNKREILEIIKKGIPLLLADMVSSLILSIDRQFVSALFSIEVYSIYSFAYSMLKVVTLSISAISAVLYPSLKRMKQTQMEESYKFSINLVSIISSGCLLIYFPLVWFVSTYLPDYSASLPLFRILLPSIVLSSIISMVMINHYKALGKQNLYFVLSLGILIFSALLNFLAYYFFSQPIGFTYASMITTIAWFICSDFYLLKRYHQKPSLAYIFLCLLFAAFYLLSYDEKYNWVSFALFLLLFIILSLCFFRHDIETFLSKLQIKKKSKIENENDYYHSILTNGISPKKGKERKQNFELLRILSMLMITINHFASNCEGILSPNPIIRNTSLFFFLFGKLGSNIFILISIWFLMDKPFSGKRFFEIWLETFTFSLLLNLISSLAFNTNITAKDWLFACLPIFGRYYWFSTAYLILLLLMPILRLIYRKSKFKWLPALISVILCSLVPMLTINGSLFSEFAYYKYVEYFFKVILWGPVWFSALFFILSFVRDSKLFLKNKFFHLTIFVISLLLMGSIEFVLFYATKLGLNIPKVILDHFSIIRDQNSILCFSCSLSLFLFFSKISIKKTRFVSFFSSGTFEMYLFQTHPFFYPIMYQKLFCFPRMSSSAFFLSCFIFMACLFLGSPLIHLVYTKLISEPFQLCHNRIKLCYKKWRIKK